MIKKLRTSFLLPAELAEISGNYYSVVLASIIEPFILKIAELLKVDVVILEKAITAVRLNRRVEEVSQADAVRDDLFVSFRDMTEVAKKRRKPEMLAAYQQVWPIIEKAGLRLYNLGYTEQSGRLDAMFSELDTPENQAHLVTMLVDEIYTELKEAQANFSVAFNDKLAEDTKTKYPTLDEAKKRTVPHINILLGAISILEETDPAAYKDVVDEINSITENIMVVARARKTRNDNREAEENAADSGSRSSGSADEAQ